MKREDLEKLGLSKEAIDQVMTMNGKDIEAGKAKATAAEQERDTLKMQLTEANQQIESFKAMDVEAIKKSADEYKTKFEQAEADTKAKLDQLKFDHALDGALTDAYREDVVGRSRAERDPCCFFPILKSGEMSFPYSSLFKSIIHGRKLL